MHINEDRDIDGDDDVDDEDEDEDDKEEVTEEDNEDNEWLQFFSIPHKCGNNKSGGGGRGIKIGEKSHFLDSFDVVMMMQSFQEIYMFKWAI